MGCTPNKQNYEIITPRSKKSDDSNDFLVSKSHKLGDKIGTKATGISTLHESCSKYSIDLITNCR